MEIEAEGEANNKVPEKDSIGVGIELVGEVQIGDLEIEMLPVVDGDQLVDPLISTPIMCKF